MMRNIVFGLALVVSCGIASLTSAVTLTPIHSYDLNNDLADAFGGPALVNNGATLGGGGLSFGGNQGPSLDGWLAGSATAGNYSIELHFSLTETASYRKLVDFKDRTVDAGLYNLDTALSFYPVENGPSGSIAANVMTHVVISSDGLTSQLVGYVNGSASQGVSFIDLSGQGTFTGVNNIIHFFRDDLSTGQSEASAGFVDFIRIYDRPVSPQEAAELYAARFVPEPASLGLAMIGAAGLLLRRRALDSADTPPRG